MDAVDEDAYDDYQSDYFISINDLDSTNQDSDTLGTTHHPPPLLPPPPLPTLLPTLQNDTPNVTQNADDELLNFTEAHFKNINVDDLEEIVMTARSSAPQYDQGVEIDKFKEFFHQQYVSKMSPVPSENNLMVSDDDMNSKSKTQYVKLTYSDVEREIERYYNIDVNDKYYTELDIMSTYVKGQKHLFVKSKYYTQYKLNFLMITSLLLTTLVTIITPFFCKYEWIEMTIIIMNSIVVLCISLINFLKLESYIEQYLQMATYYDNMETSLEFTNGKLLFLKNEEEKRELISKKLQFFEKKMIENKNSHNILIPDEIKRMFPIICSINILNFIKKSEFYKKTVIQKLLDVKNEIRFILYKWKYDQNDTKKKRMDKVKEENRLHHLYNVKTRLRDEIVDFRIIYELLDDIFMTEIRSSEKTLFYVSSFFVKNSALSKQNIKKINPMILRHFISIGLVKE